VGSLIVRQFGDMVINYYQSLVTRHSLLISRADSRTLGLGFRSRPMRAPLESGGRPGPVDPDGYGRQQEQGPEGSRRNKIIIFKNKC